ncbi:hypothetical protein SAMN05444278_103226 [Psychroflexus salarius]|uniref:Uncharacterized protein n=1 Tax=Psychroflexus salarius TaxID=1155689 RepID=A0A1M4V3L1_9FLAO|nr:hypothetical protein [Psychroflexus salarius]SHE63477.1 hypothetical protein SAMN05444278_103226 [Psychroflexus salarius]
MKSILSLFLIANLLLQNNNKEELISKILNHKEVLHYVDDPVVFKNNLSENFKDLPLTSDKEYTGVLIIKTLKKIKSNREFYKVGIFIPFENVYIEFEGLRGFDGCWDIKILSSVEY